jgi:hypothetical protein
MYRHTEQHFGFSFDPSPNDIDVNRLIQIQLLIGLLGQDGDWRNFGVKFPASHLDDLLRALNRAKKVLESDCKKTPEGYWPRRSVF